MIDVQDPNFPGSSLDINQLFSTGVGWFLTVIAATAFFSLIYSGFQYITSAGDAAKVEKARKNILWAIIALVLAVLSFVFIRLVGGSVSEL